MCLRYGYWQKAKRNCFTLISCFFTLGHHVTLEEKIITCYAANGNVLCYLLKTCNIWPETIDIHSQQEVRKYQEPTNGSVMQIWSQCNVCPSTILRFHSTWSIYIADLLTYYTLWSEYDHQSNLLVFSRVLVFWSRRAPCSSPAKALPGPKWLWAPHENYIITAEGIRPSELAGSKMCKWPEQTMRSPRRI